MSNTTKIKKKEYVKSPDVENLAEEVIKDKLIQIGNARIKYLLVYPTISKTTAGRCTRASNLLKVFGECDYVIELSGEFWDKITEEQRMILLWHELLHVLAITNDKSGEWEYRIRRHDINEFYIIVKKYGVDWHSNLKTLFSSVYDLSPEEVESFEL